MDPGMLESVEGRRQLLEKNPSDAKHILQELLQTGTLALSSNKAVTVGCACTSPSR